MRGVSSIVPEGIPSEDPLDASVAAKMGLISVSRLLIIGVICGAPPSDPIGIVGVDADRGILFQKQFWICYRFRRVGASDEAAKLLHPLIGDRADVGDLLGTWILAIVVRVVVPKLGGAAAAWKAGSGAAHCMFAAGCSR